MATVGDVRDVQGNENSLEIEALARFAVDEHNKKEVPFRFSNLSDCHKIVDEVMGS